MKKFYTLLCLSFLFFHVNGQDSTIKRIIFIGDAGHASNAQSTIIADAVSHALPDITNVVFLGNTVYPNGVSEHNGEISARSIKKMAALTTPFSHSGIPMFVLPGDRDWNHSRPGGKQRLQSLDKLIENQNDSLLRLIPQGGCPGPVAIDLAPDLVMIALDTEWWLYPYKEKDASDSCSVLSETEVIDQLRQILYRNIDKTILLTTYHPFRSRGRKSSDFSTGDYFFPLRELNKNLYLPLPGVGALYPVTKKLFPDAENTRHPDYSLMKKDISEVFNEFPNVVHVSSHQDGLQLINDTSGALPLEVVSGIGKRKPFTKKTAVTLFHENNPGYVVVDWLSDKSLRFELYAYKKGTGEKVYAYTRDYLPRDNWPGAIYNAVRTDSITTSIDDQFANRGKTWRYLFGNKYRDAWATKVKLPVIKMSEVHSGLSINKLGGGKQTRSLRFQDSTKYRLVLRSVSKVSDRVVASPFRTPGVATMVSDFFVEQYPYAALIVPPIASAVGVPHTQPVIGYTDFDSIIGPYNELFAGKVNLLEEWEPLRPTDNYEKAFGKLQKDNDNRFDGIGFLKARMLDLVIGDWDRHWDQWRFHYDKGEKHRHYLIVPRDRDMALNATDGLFYGIGKKGFLVPKVSGFGADEVKQVTQYLFKSDFMEAYPESQIPHEQWNRVVDSFANNLSDDVLKEAVNRLPTGIPEKQRKAFLSVLQQRRNQLPEAMEKYYRFINNKVDIRGSDRKEFVSIRSLPNEDAVNITMQKIDKHGQLKDTLMDKVFRRNITKEIRIYLGKDHDSVYIDNPGSTIKLRLIGGQPRKGSHKSYNIVSSKKKVAIYDYQQEQYLGNTHRIKKKVAAKDENVAFVPINRFNSLSPNLVKKISRDGGIELGLGLYYNFQNGFRSDSFATRIGIYVEHAFRTNSSKLTFSVEREKVIGNANMLVNLGIWGPNYNQNFFGAGNETRLIPADRFHKSYFGLYSLSPLLKWQFGIGKGYVQVGPTVQFYNGKLGKNTAHILGSPSLFESYDKSTLDKDKVQAGISGSYLLDRRKNRWMSHERVDPENGIVDVDNDFNTVLPIDGFFAKVYFIALGGVSKYACSMAQVRPQFSFYKGLNPKSTLVVSDRIGGAITVGRPNFYQYATLGGHGNLLGFRTFRFSGMESVYSNLMMRWVMADFGNSLFKGQFGLTGFYDVGRVWVPDEVSRKWHQGVGGGIFIAPAYAFVLHFNMGWSKEDGWFPNLDFGFRF